MSYLRHYLIICLLVIQATLAADEPFTQLVCPSNASPAECVEFLLEGNQKAYFPLHSDEKLWVLLEEQDYMYNEGFFHFAQVEHYRLTLLDDWRMDPDEGIHLLIPKNGGDVMASINRHQHSLDGNDNLAIFNEIYPVLHIQRVWFADASEIDADERHDDLLSLKLRLHAVMSRPDQTTWQERRGYSPMEVSDLGRQLAAYTAGSNDLRDFFERLYGPKAGPELLMLELPETSTELYDLAKNVLRRATIGGLLRNIPGTAKQHPMAKTLHTVATKFSAETPMADIYRLLGDSKNPQLMKLYARLYFQFFEPWHLYIGDSLGRDFFYDALNKGKSDRAEVLSHVIISGLFDDVLNRITGTMASRLEDYFQNMELLLNDRYMAANPSVYLFDEYEALFGGYLEPKLAQKAFDALTKNTKKQLMAMPAADRMHVWLHELRLAPQVLNERIGALIASQDEPDLLTFMLALRLVREKRHFVHEITASD